MTLLELRKAHKLTQAELSERLNVHRPQVVAWEKATDAIGIKTARRIMEAFDVVATLDLESKSFTFMPVDQWRKLQPSIEQMQREADMMYPDA
jgi:transcriptional regulator with XRE-family HTH domain